MRVFHYYSLLEGENGSISHIGWDKVQCLVTKVIGDLGLTKQTIAWHESDLHLMTEKQQTNPPVASSAWKVPVDRQSPTRLGRRWPSWTKHLAKKNTGNKTVSASGKNIEHDQRTWELKSETVSLLAVTPTLSSTPISTLEKVSLYITHQSSLQNTG